MAIERIGKFQVLGNLGSGAHSTILHIRRADDAKDYALKVVPIDEEEDLKFLEQARHELRVAQLLGHPNIVKIYCLELEKNWFFKVRKANLLIEYIAGKTLDTFGTIAAKALIPIAVQIADALVHMHRRGVWHADLKPNNIMLVTRTKQVKIIDFGLAWIKGEPKDRVQGTPEYMAPETLRGKLVNDQTDIYNFGATLYRLVTGKHPPSPATDGSVSINAKTWAKLLKPVAELVPTVPSDFGSLIDRCLNYEPSKRPERMSNVHDQLTQIATDLGIDLESE